MAKQPIKTTNNTNELSYLEAVQVFNFSAEVRALKTASAADKLAATRNYLALLGIKKEHEAIFETVQNEFKKQNEQAIADLQAETDKDKQAQDEKELVKLQQKHFEEEQLLIEFFAKSASILLHPFSLELVSDEANCPFFLLNVLDKLGLISCD
jgi:hypothetical protein